jgi:diacylglycerol kinase family enzyme
MLTKLGPVDCIPTLTRKCYKESIVSPCNDAQFISPHVLVINESPYVVIVYNPSLNESIRKMNTLVKEMKANNIRFSKFINLPLLCQLDYISHICIVGGDGTVNKVINDAFKDNQSLRNLPPIAIFSAGTNNSIARAVGSDSVHVKEFVMSFKKGMVRKLDVGHLKNAYAERVFLSYIGWGRPVINSMSIDKFRGDSRMGKAWYMVHRLWNLFKCSRSTVDFNGVVNDVGIIGEFTDVTMNILRHVENLMWSPMSYADDGVMEFIRTENSDWSLYRDAVKGIHIYRDDVMIIRCKKLLVFSSTLLTADGNMLNMTNPLEVSMNHKELHCVTFV